MCEDLFDQLFVGLDYSLNAESELYFNIFFEAVGAAFERGPKHIFVGQTSDDFKHQKLSSHQVPLFVYAKGIKLIPRRLMASHFSWFFPNRPMKFPAP